VSATRGVVLAALRAAATAVAGFFGWSLVQDYRVGLRLTREQGLAGPAVQHTHAGRRHAA
jgi:hypothetical protein